MRAVSGRSPSATEQGHESQRQFWCWIACWGSWRGSVLVLGMVQPWTRRKLVTVWMHTCSTQTAFRLKMIEIWTPCMTAWPYSTVVTTCCSYMVFIVGSYKYVCCTIAEIYFLILEWVEAAHWWPWWCKSSSTASAGREIQVIGYQNWQICIQYHQTFQIIRSFWPFWILHDAFWFLINFYNFFFVGIFCWGWRRLLPLVLRVAASPRVPIRPG